MKIKNLVLSSTAALALFAVSNQVANADTVTVNAGDTVSSIAAAHQTTVQAIDKANNLSNVNLIFVGDKLEVNGNQVVSNSTENQVTSQASSVATSQAPKTNQQTTRTQVVTPASQTTNNGGASSQSEVLSQMQARTGGSASTWNRIITRESNWNTSVKNSASGAYGLFQNMHISSGSVQDQVNAAVNLYHSQGMNAWGE